MDIGGILVPERTVAGLAAGSKKRALEEACRRMAASLPLDAGSIYRGLLARERLGSTALGEGVALPHCRLEACRELAAGLFTLGEGVAFDALDGLPVRIMAVLLAPPAAPGAQQHLSALAMLAERLQREDYRQALLAADTSAALHQAAIAPLPDAPQEPKP